MPNHSTQSVGDKIHEFHSVFGLPINSRPASDVATVRLRESLIREEYNEVLEAISDWMVTPNKTTKAHLLKELCDLTYVAVGFAETIGANFDVAFNRVHQSNMGKVWEDGKVHRNEQGKILKPPTFKQPFLEDLV